MGKLRHKTVQGINIRARLAASPAPGSTLSITVQASQSACWGLSPVVLEPPPEGTDPTTVEARTTWLSASFFLWHSLEWSWLHTSLCRMLPSEVLLQPGELWFSAAILSGNTSAGGGCRARSCQAVCGGRSDHERPRPQPSDSSQLVVLEFPV